MQQIKEISDSLTVDGVAISNLDLTTTTLVRLLENYKSFTDLVMLHLSSTSINELHGLLLTNELSMSRRKKNPSSSAQEPFDAFSVQS